MTLTKKILNLSLFCLIISGWASTVASKYDPKSPEDRERMKQVCIDLDKVGLAKDDPNCKEFLNGNVDIKLKVGDNKINNKRIDISRLEIKTKKILTSDKEIDRKIVYAIISSRSHRIVFNEDGNFLSFIINLYNYDDSLILWANGNLTYEKGLNNIRYVIKPIKDVNIYILIDVSTYYGVGAVSVYNFDNKKHVLLKGILKALDDVDGDKIPEIITVSGYGTNAKVYLYKFLKKNGKWNIGILADHIIDTDVRDKISIIKTFPPRWRFFEAKYSQKDNMIILTPNQFQLSNCCNIKKDNEETCWNKCIDPYFEKWQKENFKFSSTFNKVIGGDIEDINIDNISKKLNYNLSKIDKIKLLNKLDHILYLRACVDLKYGKIDKVNGTKRPIINNLLLCRTDLKNKEDSIIKNEYGQLLFLDFNTGKFNIAKNNIFGLDLYLISDEKYLIISDGDKSNYFFWKDILGYKPISVLYIDGKYLLTVREIANKSKKRYKKRYKIDLYELSFNLLEGAKENW